MCRLAGMCWQAANTCVSLLRTRMDAAVLAGRQREVLLPGLAGPQPAVHTLDPLGLLGLLHALCWGVLREALLCSDGIWQEVCGLPCAKERADVQLLLVRLPPHAPNVTDYLWCEGLMCFLSLISYSRALAATSLQRHGWLAAELTLQRCL